MNYASNPKGSGNNKNPRSGGGKNPNFIPPGTNRGLGTGPGGKDDNQFVVEAQANALGIVAITDNKNARKNLAILFGLAASGSRALNNTPDQTNPIDPTKSEIQQVIDIMADLGYQVTTGAGGDLPANKNGANTKAKNWNTPDNVKQISDLLQAINKLNGDVPSISQAT